MSREILFIDTEVNPRNNRVFDYGALKDTGEEMRSSSGDDFGAFIHGASWLSGHNILDFDLQYTGGRIMKECPDAGYIDTLYLSPLMFPERPYHRLIKDDKLQNDELNNPLSDAKQSRKVFEDERAAFLQMSETQQAHKQLPGVFIVQRALRDGIFLLQAVDHLESQLFLCRAHALCGFLRGLCFLNLFP